MSDTAPVITIDGPTGSGKGTLASLLAQHLGWHWLDSGAIYRLFALAVQEKQAEMADVATLCDIARALNIAFEASKSGQKVYLDGIDVSKAIRSEVCGMLASKLSAMLDIRAALLERQRAFCQLPGLVTDGRDMGTIVFPDAKLKIFLEASVHERAKRRYEQLKNQDVNAKLASILRALEQRDKQDSERDIAPLVPAIDAIIIDSTKLSIEQVLAKVIECAKERELV